MATPTLIQQISAAANSSAGGNTNPSGNAYKIPITHPVGAGNCIILCISYLGGLTGTITDNNSNSWPVATVTVDPGSPFTASAVFVLPNANSGQTTITCTFGSTTKEFTYNVSEWMNVATASPVDGGAGVGFNSTQFNCPAAPYTTGSFTPTNAAGNDLIFAYYCFNGNGQVGIPTNWTPGGSFILLDADLGTGVTNSQAGTPHASMYFIQASSAAINPSITMNGDTSDTVNAIGIALKSASAGTARAAGIHIDNLKHWTNDLLTGNLLSRCVFTGNLRVLVCSFTRTSGGITISSVTDSDGNTWTDASAGAADKPPIFYKVNTTASANTLITITTTGTFGSQKSWRIYDISGADPAAFDTYVGTVGTAFSTGSVSNAPSITPGVSNGITIATVLVGLGNAHSVTAPAAAVYEACDYTGNGANDQLDNADGIAHDLFSSNAAQNWAWTMTANGGNTWWSAAATFKSAATDVLQSQVIM